MNEQDLSAIVCTGKPYATPPEFKRSATDRLLGRFDPWFVLQVFRIVASGTRFAKRNEFTPTVFAAHAALTLRLVERCGGRVELDGLHHVAALQTPAVFVANHMSMLETFVIPGVIQPFRPVTVILKQELLRYPMFGVILRQLQCISVTRTDPRADLTTMLREGAERLGRGISLLVFPQSTRSFDVDPSKFNSIGAKLAARTELPVIPVAVDTAFIGKGRILHDFGRINRAKPVRMRFHAPVPTTGNGRDAHHATIQTIVSTITNWRKNTHPA